MEIIKRIVLILLAALVVVGLILPLANTVWADNIRSGDSGEENMESAARSDMSVVLLALISLVKALVFMAIPFGITLLVLRLTSQKTQKPANAK